MPPKTHPLVSRGCRLSKRKRQSLVVSLFEQAIPICVLALSMLLLQSTALAATHDDSKSDVKDDGLANQAKTADALVAEALSHEIYGEREVRNRLLQVALEIDPDHAVARWHLGYVKSEKDWVQLSDLQQQAIESRLLQAYQSKRSEALNTAEDQLALARWCDRRGLDMQERAHLYQVIKLQPDHVGARAKLGFENVDGEWVLRRDLVRQQELATSRRFAEEAWNPKAIDLAKRVTSPSPKERELALEELADIDKVSAIPALEAHLMTIGPAETTAVLDCIGSMPSTESSLWLCRYALVLPTEELREYAATKLKDRDLVEYVPAMLDEMRTPILAVDQIVRGRQFSKDLVHQRIEFQEGRDAIQTRQVDTNYRRRIPIGHDNVTWANMIRMAAVDSARQSAELVNENLVIDQQNQLVAAALRTATGEALQADPKVWWKWWDEHTQRPLDGGKTTVSQYFRDEIHVGEQFDPDRPVGFSQVVDPQDIEPVQVNMLIRQPLTGIQAPQPSSVPLRAYGIRIECLVRGTPVLTTSGLVAIESIRPGDLVYAKDVETGELGIRPVLELTSRDKGPTVEIVTANDSIKASPGHPFWVSGEGWLMASELKSGMELHTREGSVAISEVKPGEAEVTFNLVIDEFGTYFVGYSQILSHDFTEVQPTDYAIPGLKR